MRTRWGKIFILAIAVLMMSAGCLNVPKQLTYKTIQPLNTRTKYPIKVAVVNFEVTGPTARQRENLYDEPLGRAFAKRFAEDLKNSRIFKEVVSLDMDLSGVNPEDMLRNRSIRYVFTGNVERFYRRTMPHWINFIPPIIPTNIGCGFGIPYCSAFNKAEITAHIKILDLETGVTSFNNTYRYVDREWTPQLFNTSYTMLKRDDRLCLTAGTKKFNKVVLKSINTGNIFAGPVEASAPAVVTRSTGVIKRKYNSIVVPPHSGEKAYVAVLDLRGASGSDSERLATALSDPLRVELQSTGYFRVCDRANIETVMAEIGFQQTGCTSSQCVVQVGRILGVEKIISGSVSKLGDTYIVNLQLIDVGTALVEKSISEKAECKEGELVYLLGIAAKKLCLGK